MYEFILLSNTETSFSFVQEKCPENNNNIDITHNVNIKINKDLSLSLSLEILLNNKEEIFLESKIELYFNFSESTLENFRKESTDKLTLPKELISHLISIAVGINRGIILCKTKEKNKEFLLPLINISELIKDDLTIKFPA